MSAEWMPREQWDALVRGDGCPVCASLESSKVSDRFGHTVADLRSGRLRLARNQWVKGYCTFICFTHVREPWELRSRERAAYFEDMTRAGQALERVFGSVKMNFEILGNVIPHLHCHLIPRFYGDPAPSRLINPDEQALELDEEEYERRAAAIREALEWV